MAKSVMKKGKTQKRKVYRKRGGRVQIGRMPIMNTGNFASRSETLSYTATAGQVYSVVQNLVNLVSSKAIAQQYQYYRFTSVRMRIKPNYDTFVAPGAPGGQPSLPYLYFLFDKSGSLGSLSAPQFEQAGAVPQRVDDKTILRSWKPSVLLNTGQGAGVETGMFKVSPWLPTFDPTGVNLNNVTHYGAVFYISKMNATDASTYDIDITTTVQFRKPLVVTAAGGVQALELPINPTANIIPSNLPPEQT